MTLPGLPGGPGRRSAGVPTPPHPAPADPEAVLSQALRAMAGGAKPGRPDRQPATTPVPRARLSVLQIILIAVILGLLVGITAGLVTLLV